MRNRIWKLVIAMCLVAAGSGMFLACGGEAAGSGMFLACGGEKKPPLLAEVGVAHQSIYVWNRGAQAWPGGKVFLNDRSQNISRPMGTIQPKGFAQLPIREFRQGGKSVLKTGLEITSVCVEVEGYATAKFPISWKGK
ncbi:MAG: hypothetical protein JRF69_13435 [Deltaproteobacteria bacterium]|nr:hypothetical protein [Deltaproteobacteria bacterium]